MRLFLFLFLSAPELTTKRERLNLLYLVLVSSKPYDFGTVIFQSPFTRCKSPVRTASFEVFNTESVFPRVAQEIPIF